MVVVDVRRTGRRGRSNSSNGRSQLASFIKIISKVVLLIQCVRLKKYGLTFESNNIIITLS